MIEPSQLTNRNLSEGDLVALSHMVDVAARLAEGDCWCERPCEPDKPGCDVCRARLALKQLERLVDFECRTLHPERLKSEAERIYFDEWTAENVRHGWLNGGVRALEHILNPDLSKPAPPVSQHDAEVATTLVQWLGTNCGLSFIQRCEKRIKDAKASRYSNLRASELNRFVEMAERPTSPPDPLRETAETIAGKYQSIQDRSPYRNLAAEIYAALVDAAKGGQP